MSTMTHQTQQDQRPIGRHDVGQAVAAFEKGQPVRVGPLTISPEPDGRLHVDLNGRSEMYTLDQFEQLLDAAEALRGAPCPTWCTGHRREDGAGYVHYYAPSGQEETVSAELRLAIGDRRGVDGDPLVRISGAEDGIGIDQAERLAWSLLAIAHRARKGTGTHRPSPATEAAAEAYAVGIIESVDRVLGKQAAAAEPQQADPELPADAV